MLEQVAENGKRTTITLDDGTRVTLNGGSRLRYSAGTTQRGQNVYLEGEALFEVKHNPSRTFRVHAAHGTVQDIGTRFVVRAFANRPDVEVVVTEGAVSLRNDSASTPPIQLAAGEGGIISGKDGAPRKLAPDALPKFVAWTTGVLILDNIALRDAAADIERWYGVHVVVDPSIAMRPVAARFHNETVSQALDAITLALGARYSLRDSTYVISPRAR